MQIYDVLIVGAGLAGLSAARHLIRQGNGGQVLLLEQGEVPGGRMATLMGELPGEMFDHGAQFFTVRSPEFRLLVDEFLEMGLIQEWCRGFSKRPGEAPREDGHPRYYIPEGMNSLPGILARDLDLRLSSPVTHLEFVDTSEAGPGKFWRVTTATAEVFQARELILTPPVPRSLELLRNSGINLMTQVRGALQSIQYVPCFAALVSLSHPGKIPVPGAYQLESNPIHFIADNYVKGISRRHTMTIHAGVEFSHDYADSPPVRAARLLVEAASELLPQENVIGLKGIFWKYSRPQVLHLDRYLRTDVPGPLIFAGDAFGEPRVEGAYLSGLAAAQAVLGSHTAKAS